jgi:hypothetical protein
MHAAIVDVDVVVRGFPVTIPRSTAGRLIHGLHPAGASDVPHLELIELHSPSPFNPFGIKGVGEGSAIASGVSN